MFKQKKRGAVSQDAVGITNETDRISFRRTDWIPALVILAAAGCLLVFFQVARKPGGNCAEVRVDGVLKGVYALDRDDIFEIRTEYGVNRVQIKDGEVSVIDADCAGHDCIQQGSIHLQNETIVCLPHKLVIEITKRDDADETQTEPEETGFDTVAK